MRMHNKSNNKVKNFLTFRCVAWSVSIVITGSWCRVIYLRQRVVFDSLNLSALSHIREGLAECIMQMFK